MSKKAYQLTAVETIDPTRLLTMHTNNGAGPSVKITLEDFLAGLVRDTLSVGVSNADYLVDDIANLHTPLQAALNEMKDRGGGVVQVKGAGEDPYHSAQVVIPVGVSIFFDPDCYIIGKTNAAPNLFISENFATYAGSGNAFGLGNAHGFITGGHFEGGNQTPSGAGSTQYRNQNAVFKLYLWDYTISDIRINYASEVGLYTEHDNDWNDDGTFNTYEFGETVFRNIKIKNYGIVGWVNRGPHDSVSDAIYISSSDGAGVNADYGYVQQSSNTAGEKWGAHGHVANYLHVWGQHNWNAVLLDGSNILNGFVYAEGSDFAAVFIRNSSANRFNAFVGYCTHGIEFQGTSNGNEITAIVESNVSGDLFRLNDAVSSNVLRQGPGYGFPGGAVFGLETGSYTGGKNTFELWPGNTATEISGLSVMGFDDVLISPHRQHLQYSPRDDSFSGQTILATAGESLVFGDVCYVKSDGKMGKADADAIATAGAMFVALGTTANNAKGLFLVGGVVRDDSAYNFTPGGFIYLSTTAGGITQTPPSGAADVVQLLGVALTADKWLFHPNLAMVEIVS